MSSDLMDDFETALATALREEAATVTPATDGLAQIRLRIAGDGGARPLPVRRPRSAWLGTRGAIVATAAVAVLATVLGVTLVGGGPGGQSLPANRLQQSYPTAGIFPLPGDLAAHRAAYRTPQASVTAWLRTALHLQGQYADGVTVRGGVADVAIRASTDGNLNYLVGRAALQRFDGAWVITQVTAPKRAIRITGATVAANGVRAAGTASPRALGTVTLVVAGFLGTQRFAPAGSGSIPTDPTTESPWQATIVAGHGGAHLAVVALGEDTAHRVLAITARAVAATPRRGATVPTTAVPADFYAITNGATVDEYATGSGRHVMRLTPQQSEVQLSELQRSGSLLYFIRGGTSGCANSLQSVDPSSGAVRTVLRARTGQQITGYGVMGQTVATLQTSCGSRATRWQLVGTDLASGRQHAFSWTSEPPGLQGDPAWIDATDVVTISISGTEAGLTDIKPMTATSLQGTLPADCSTFDSATYRPAALTFAGSTLYVAALSAGHGVVLSCSGAHPHRLFRLPGQRPIDSIAATAGGVVLVRDQSGGLWDWDGHSLHRVLASASELTPVW